jgi:phosphoglycolate phosphatase-like HAD superfamily hydrolase
VSTGTTDPRTLRHILTRITALLLDFDGPVCSVFAGLPAATVVNQLCGVLADGGHTDLPVQLTKSDDPFEVLAYAASLGETEAHYVNAAFTAHELEAIATAEPTPGAHDLIRAWTATGRPLAIVSNNSAIAIRAYLDLHGLSSHVAHVSARTSPDPAQTSPALADHRAHHARRSRRSRSLPRRLHHRHHSRPLRWHDIHRVHQQTRQDEPTHYRRGRRDDPHPSYHH